jgi:transcriptional regulator with XRE-family HTH domain
MLHMWGMLAGDGFRGSAPRHPYPRIVMMGVRLFAASALVLGMVAAAPGVAAGEESSPASATDTESQTATEEEPRGLDVALVASDGRVPDPGEPSAPSGVHQGAATEPAAEPPTTPVTGQGATAPLGRTHAAAAPSSSSSPSEPTGPTPTSAAPMPVANGHAAAEPTTVPPDSPGAAAEEGDASALAGPGPIAPREAGRSEDPPNSPVSTPPPGLTYTPPGTSDHGTGRGTPQVSTEAAPMPERTGSNAQAASQRRATVASSVIIPVERRSPVPLAPPPDVVADAPDTAGIVATGVLAAGPRVSTAVSVAMDFARLSGGWAGPLVFNIWLRRQMRERRLSQRQLASLSGVDHSTISRLITGGRSPSLETAAKLVHALRLEWTEDQVATYFDLLPEHTLFPTQRVESALRGDPELDDPDVRRLMKQYLSLRQRRRSAAGRPSRPPGHGASRIAASIADQSGEP